MTTLTPFRRQQVRAAAKIHEHLLGKARTVNVDLLPARQWEDVQQFASRLRLTQTRGWLVASRSVSSDLLYATRRLAQELQSFQTLLGHPQQRPAIATPAEILADLTEIFEEFEQVAIDLREATISASTEPIELEKTHLGAFRIVLFWSEIGRQRPYEVVACDPHRPSGHSDVTHPHVRDDILCEGDGVAAIKAALSSGRLLDFFVLVRQILRNYNPASAHVPLDDWHGVACQDCGFQMDFEDYSICDRCDDPLCHDCSSVCQCCHCSYCVSCGAVCAQCDRSFCHGCLATLAGEAEAKCLTCQQKGAEPDEEETGQTPTADALCLGQALAAS